VDFAKHCIVKPGTKLHIETLDPGETFGIAKDDHKLAQSLEQLRKQQYLLYAERSRALLIVLQALDAGGKDGTIQHVMSGVNPQGCQVAAFKVPTSEEKAHDFLWRIHQKVPEFGNIGIFNRSHYEDVLVARVHNLVAKEEWSKRYDQINDFERMLTENKVTILKFFLHIGKDEQKKRFEERLQDPSKNWKLSLPDFEERKHWDEYMKAYQSALRKCSTEWAPWYVIPANDKWRRNYIIADIIVQTLDEMKLRYPPPAMDLSKVKIDD
jgi:PPK2 family polyphosphate:nucleotide phosphotransferase